MVALIEHIEQMMEPKSGRGRFMTNDQPPGGDYS